MSENRLDTAESSIVAKIAGLLDEPRDVFEPVSPQAAAECVELLQKLWAKADAGAQESQNRPLVETPMHCAPKRLGRYELRDLIGVGGFGAVYRAYDPELKREVAIKIPRPEVLFSASLRNRFLREAQLAADLDHPGIVPVHEAGEVWPAWYIVMGLCRGPTLAAWLLAEEAPIPERTAAEIVARLAEATHHAHTRGVLHRDLKPSNVLLEPQEEPRIGSLPFVPRITDFGLAKCLADGDKHTASQSIVGTIDYMAPEQIEGRASDISIPTDVYALGILLLNS